MEELQKVKEKKIIHDTFYDLNLETKYSVRLEKVKTKICHTFWVIVRVGQYLGGGKILLCW